jgi:hypothetical protein
MSAADAGVRLITDRMIAAPIGAANRDAKGARAP